MSSPDIRACGKALVSAIAELANSLSEEADNEKLRALIRDRLLEPSSFFASLIRLSMRLIMIERVRTLGFGVAIDSEAVSENKTSSNDSIWDLSMAEVEAEFFHRLMGSRRLNVGVRSVEFAHLALCDASAHTYRSSIRSSVEPLSDGWRLGAVYEELLRYTAVWSDERLIIEVMKGYRRKSHGAYYTPSVLVGFALSAVVEELLGRRKCGNRVADPIYICDPACGDGLFLTSAFDQLTSANRGLKLSAPQAIRGLCGVDVDEQAVELTRFNLAGCVEFDESAIAHIATNIRKGNALLSAWATDFRGQFEAMSARFEGAGDFFHWQQEFKDIFSRRGGFDLVVGNPPWEKLEITDSEYFAGRAKALPRAATREDRLKKLKSSQPDLFSGYEKTRAKRSALREFVKRSGYYPLTAHGRLNTYSLFAELSLRLASDEGRVHLFLPTGIVTDFSTRHFVASLLETRRIFGLFDFDNRSRFFADVQGNVQFCLLCLGGRAERQFRLRTGINNADSLSMADGFQLSIESVGIVNPETKSIPMFSTVRDACIIEGLHRKFLTFSGTHWAPSLRQGTYNMTSNAHLFVRDESRVDAAVTPLYEAKLCHQFDHRHGTFEGVSTDKKFGTHPATRAPKLSCLQEASYEVEPRYWVDRADAVGRLNGESWALVFRNTFSSAADARSLVATILPAVGIGNSLSLIETTRGAVDAAVLCCVLNSMLMDYLVREKSTGSNLNFYVIRQLPMPNLSFFEKVFGWTGGQRLNDWLAARCLELTYTSKSLSGFGQALGGPLKPFTYDLARRHELRVEIDAGIFLALEVPRTDVVHILGTFKVLRRKEQKLHGRYRYMEHVLCKYDTFKSQSD